jgi:hypothetical protein
MPFRDFLVRLGPTWLQRPRWAAFLGSYGQALDDLVDRAKLSVKARFPSYAPTDALTAIGGERQIPRVPGETDDHYAARLLAAWESWKWGGTALGLLRALNTAGFTGAKLEIVNGLQYELNTQLELVITQLPRGSWLIDSDQTFWSKFQVVFCHPTLPPRWRRRLPSAVSDEVNALRALILKWSPGFATCAGIAVITQGRSFGFPTGRTRASRAGLTFGTLRARGYRFTGNAVTLWRV